MVRHYKYFRLAASDKISAEIVRVPVIVARRSVVRSVQIQLALGVVVRVLGIDRLYLAARICSESQNLPVHRVLTGCECLLIFLYLVDSIQNLVCVFIFYSVDCNAVGKRVVSHQSVVVVQAEADAVVIPPVMVSSD